MVTALEKPEAWRIKQASTIGGSSAAAVVGESRFTTRRDLWRKMVDARRGMLAPSHIGDDLRRGLLLEPLARDLLAEKLGERIREHDQNEFVVDPSKPWAHCLPDGWLNPKRIVELKIPRPGTIARVKTRGMLHEWFVQAQHNLGVTGADVCVFGLLDPITCEVHTENVFRADGYIGDLMVAEAEFFEAVVDNREPCDHAFESPKIEDDGSQEAGAPVVVDTDEARDLARTLLRLRDARDDAADMFEVFKVRLLDAVGDSTDAVEIPGLDYSSEVAGKFFAGLRIINRETKPRASFDKAAALRWIRRAYDLLAPVVKAIPAMQQTAIDELLRSWDSELVDAEVQKRGPFDKLGEPSRPFRMYPIRATS